MGEWLWGTLAQADVDRLRGLPLWPVCYGAIALEVLQLHSPLLSPDNAPTPTTSVLATNRWSLCSHPPKLAQGCAGDMGATHRVPLPGI